MTIVWIGGVSALAWPGAVEDEVAAVSAAAAPPVKLLKAASKASCEIPALDEEEEAGAGAAFPPTPPPTTKSHSRENRVQLVVQVHVGTSGWSARGERGGSGGGAGTHQSRSCPSRSTKQPGVSISSQSLASPDRRYGGGWGWFVHDAVQLLHLVLVLRGVGVLHPEEEATSGRRLERQEIDAIFIVVSPRIDLLQSLVAGKDEKVHQYLGRASIAPKEMQSSVNPPFQDNQPSTRIGLDAEAIALRGLEGNGLQFPRLARAQDRGLSGLWWLSGRHPASK